MKKTVAHDSNARTHYYTVIIQHVLHVSFLYSPTNAPPILHAFSPNESSEPSQDGGSTVI
jgi:hypothetical protein